MNLESAILNNNNTPTSFLLITLSRAQHALLHFLTPHTLEYSNSVLALLALSKGNRSLPVEKGSKLKPTRDSWVGSALRWERDRGEDKIRLGVCVVIIKSREKW